MARARSPFTEADVTRALRAFQKAGVATAGVCFSREGFCVLVGDGEPPQEVQDNEVEDWISQHARQA